ASHPQTHRTRATPRGQVIQKGACSEKLPSEKRNELARAAKMEATANTPSIAYGMNRRMADRHSFGGVTSRNNGSRMIADSLESKASANSNMPAGLRRCQQTSAPTPNRNCAGSVNPANQTTAS